MPISDPIVAYVDFVDGVRRPVFEQLEGRQHAFDDDGERVYGVWFIPRDGDIDLPVVVDCR